MELAPSEGEGVEEGLVYVTDGDPFRIVKLALDVYRHLFDSINVLDGEVGVDRGVRAAGIVITYDRWKSLMSHRMNGITLGEGLSNEYEHEALKKVIDDL